MQGEGVVEVKCPCCARVVAVILPDGSVQIAARHGGMTHYTVIRAVTLEKYRRPLTASGIITS